MEQLVVAVIVYNRIENIQHWISCWQQCDTTNARLIIIHNLTRDRKLNRHMKSLCSVNNIQYVERVNIGLDVGAFQDVCRGRLDIGQWDLLIWNTDDVFPMTKDFIARYNEKYSPDTVVAMQISPYVRNHIRTTSFMIDKQTAQKIRFPADPVVTKYQCYLFEHRDPANHFLTQVKAIQLAPNEVSPMWDVGYHRRINRLKEHEDVFGPFKPPAEIEQKEVTTFICPVYKTFPAIITSLIMQTNRNWNLWLIHDGPSEDSIDAYVTMINDDRITYFQTEKYIGNYGHAIRSEYLQKVTSKYVVITNPDNYYVPSFIEKCLKTFTLKGTTVAVYSAQMVHNYVNWGVMQCKVARGHIDCGGVMLRAEEAKEVGWKNITDHSADWFFFEAVAREHGINSFLPVPGCLYIHN